MKELIKQAFIGQHVHDGYYDLVGIDGEIMLSQVWETMVQPDWTITMHMWPMEDPAPRSPPPPPPRRPPPPPLVGKNSISTATESTNNEGQFDHSSKNPKRSKGTSRHQSSPPSSSSSSSQSAGVDEDS